MWMIKHPTVPTFISSGAEDEDEDEDDDSGGLVIILRDPRLSIGSICEESSNVVLVPDVLTYIVRSLYCVTTMYILPTHHPPCLS